MQALTSGQPDWVASFLSRYEAAPLIARVTSALLLVTAAVHVTLPFGHPGTPVMTLAFLAEGAALLVLSVAAFTERRWRPVAALVLTASIIAYLIATGSGREEPDQVGIVTKLVELAALGLIMIPRHVTGSVAPVRGIKRQLTRLAASAAIVLLTVVTGAVVWIGSTTCARNRSPIVASPPAR